MERVTADRETPNEFFCPAPFATTCIDPEGAVVPCAIYRKEAEQKSDGTVKYKTLVHSKFDEAHNSEAMNNLRKAMMAGEKPEGCESCHISKRAGGWIYRNYMLDRFNTENLLEGFDDKTGEINKPKIHFIDMALTNKCNLRCRMCSPTFCSGLTKEEAECQGRKYEGDNNLFFEIPSEHLFSEDLQLLKLQGGESLLDPNLVKNLEKLVEEGRASTLSLQLNTNATLITKKHLELFSHFEYVDVLCSVDGWGEVNNYIRHLSKWSVLHKKLHMVHEFTKDLPNIKFGITTAIQLYNVFHLPDFIKNVWDEFQIESNLQFVHDPVFLSIKVLPQEKKAQLVETFKQLCADEKYKTAALRLESVIQFILEEDLSDHADEFVRYTKFLDKSRGQDVLKACPELDFFFG